MRNRWDKHEDDSISFDHDLYIDDYQQMKRNEDAFKRHLLLELLDYLQVIEYTRGYDGHYYTVWIRKRDGK